jgi:hypothetical protein
LRTERFCVPRGGERIRRSAYLRSKCPFPAQFSGSKASHCHFVNQSLGHHPIEGGSYRKRNRFYATRQYS